MSPRSTSPSLLTRNLTCPPTLNTELATVAPSDNLTNAAAATSSFAPFGIAKRETWPTSPSERVLPQSTGAGEEPWSYKSIEELMKERADTENERKEQINAADQDSQPESTEVASVETIKPKSGASTAKRCCSYLSKAECDARSMLFKEWKNPPELGSRREIPIFK